MAKKITYSVNGVTVISGNNIKAINSNLLSTVKSVKFGTNEYWKKSVTLTNLVGSASIHAGKSWSDSGTASGSETLKTIASVTNHRYFVYCKWSGYAYKYQDTFYYSGHVAYNSTELVGKTSYIEFSRIDISDKRIITADNNSLAFKVNYSRQNNSQGDSVGDLYMVVDLTELEAATGVTYTVETFWEKIGSEAFYGTKEVET